MTRTRGEATFYQDWNERAYTQFPFSRAGSSQQRRINELPPLKRDSRAPGRIPPRAHKLPRSFNAEAQPICRNFRANRSSLPRHAEIAPFTPIASRVLAITVCVLSFSLLSLSFFASFSSFFTVDYPFPSSTQEIYIRPLILLNTQLRARVSASVDA